MARATRLCHVCGATFATPAEREAHRAAEHPDVRTEWRGRTLWIIGPDGERHLTSHELRMLRARARKGPVPAPAVAAKGPEPAGDEAPAPERIGSRIGPQAPPPADGGLLTRTTIEAGLDPAILASILRELSVVLSAADGAGPAGELTVTEARLAADLLYEQTVTMIERRFHGDVGRFKAALALVILLAAKGRVHLAAIAARRRPGTRSPAPEPTIPTGTPPEAPAATVPVPGVDTGGNGSAPGSLDLGARRPADPERTVTTAPMTLAELARRQAAYLAGESDPGPVRMPDQVRPSILGDIYGG